MPTPKTIDLTPEVQAALIEFYKVAQNYPLSKAAQEHRRKIQSGELIECPRSKVLYDSKEVETIQDQIGPVINRLHPKLRSEVKGMIPVVCIQCREVVSWVPPGKDKDGFETKAGDIVHIYCCPACEPEKFIGKEVETPFIEKQLFLKYR
jgi:hypothetical protein